MKKSYIPISDVSNEKNELTRRIYRSLTEVVRQLDDVRGRSQTVSNLFLPCLATLKIKLHDLCYKLILTDPLGYGKKGEELLWRKGYHDMFTTAKRLRKNDTWSTEEIEYVQGLLISGIGHYQHLLLKLQTDYKLDFQGIMDFPLNICDLGLPKGKNSPQQKQPDKNLVLWAKESCHRCLIYLGDLNRYLLDLYPAWDSGTAERYYLQAANMNINCGRPYNQLGTLAGSKNYNLDAVYNYLRSIICPEPFQGAEGNLKKALDKNSEFVQLEPFLPNPAPGIQKLIMRFLFLFDVWYFEKTVDNNLHASCHEMLQEFQTCLREENTNSIMADFNDIEISNLTPFKDRSVVNPDHLDSDMVLKMIILVLLCVDKLHKKDSPQTSAVVAMSLAMFSQLLQQMIEKFQHFYSGFNPPEIFSNESQKSLSSSESQPSTVRTEKYKKRNKFERLGHHTNGNSFKKISKYAEKQKKNYNYENNVGEMNSLGVQLSDMTVNETEKEGKKLKKKSKLKRRKRVRSESSCESDLSDSDIVINDSSSENDSFSGDSDSEEVLTSESEDLDETLLIIDQKIKEKKNKDEEKSKETNGMNNSEDEAKTQKEENPLNNITDMHDLEKEIMKNGILDQNGIKLPNEKDKTKSLFTILNGVEEDVKLNENNRGDFTLQDSIISGDATNGNTLSESATNESSELAETIKDIDSSTSIFNARQIDAKKFLVFLQQQGVLKAIKVYCDWLQTDAETVKACSKSSKTLLGKLVTFFNLIAFEEELFSEEWGKVKGNSDKIPLSEDMVTRGLNMLHRGHEKLDWEYHSLNRISTDTENLLRLSKITGFGHYLTKIEETGILFNKQSNVFYLAGQNGKVSNMPLETVNKKNASNASRKGQLMKNMGQLWLKAEVRDLESRVRRRAGNFSPYLVVDSEALIDHIVLIKQLVGSRQFIVIIPTVVLSHLDECKRDSGRARETIRWLESQFQHGNRSLRAQKSQERISLPLIKYPKKKDKEAWNFFQIVECCHYFSKQSEFQSCPSSLLVTLLTGQRDITFVGDNKKDDFGKDYSPMGVAKNFGINLEHIETFHTKWKLSTKSHG